MTLNLDIYFRRPLFWDDTFSVMVDEQNGEWKAICLAKDGKVATEAKINLDRSLTHTESGW